MGSSTYFGASHLDFCQLPLDKKKKMHNYEVINTKFDYAIGIIHWRGGWRQYVFQGYTHDESDSDIFESNGIKCIPIENLYKLDMSRSCQKEINEFIDKIMKEWRDALNSKKED